MLWLDEGIGIGSRNAHDDDYEAKQNPADELANVATDDAEYSKGGQRRDGPQHAKERAGIKEERAAAAHLGIRWRASYDPSRLWQQCRR